MYNAQVSSTICQECEICFTEALQTDACNKVTSPTRAFAKLDLHLSKKEVTKQVGAAKRQDKKNKDCTNFRPRISDWRSNGHAFCVLSFKPRIRDWLRFSILVTHNVSVTLQVQVSLEDNTEVKHRVRQDDTVTISLLEHSRDVHGMLRLQDSRIELILDQFPCPPMFQQTSWLNKMTRDDQNNT